jgi:hypothetical protein
MGKERDLSRLNDAEFKRILGVKRGTYKAMLEILQKAFTELHRDGGKTPKLSVEDKLQIALQYMREYRTMDSIRVDWGVCKATISNSIRWVEDTLIKDGKFSLPGKKALREKTAELSVIVVDVTESPVQRPKKNKKGAIPGRKSGIPSKTR